MLKKWKQLLCLLLGILLLTLNTASCSKAPAAKQEEPETPQENTSDSESEDANHAFEVFTDQIFKSEIASNTLNLHYTLADPESYGITDYPITIGDYSKQSELASYTAAENYRKSLESFPYEHLSKENQLTYDILFYSLNMQLESGQYNLFEEPLSPTIGTQAQLPVLLAEYSFYSKNDITTYLALLEQIPACYESIIDFQKRKAKAGLFMSDTAVDHIVAQCSEFIQDPENNYLIEIFAEKVDAFPDLTEEEKTAFKDANLTAVTTAVIPAYELLMEGLADLKGSGVNEMGLCYYENGKNYYEHLVQRSTGSSRTVPELKKLAENQMTQDVLLMNEVLAEDPSLITQLDAIDIQVEDPEQTLRELQESIKADFPEPPEVSYQVKYVHPSLEQHLSPAFYLVPPIDNIAENAIYINRANNYDGIDLYTTLAHEGYPGHLYQTIYSASCETNIVRELFNFSGYVEGWATYVEMQSYYLSGLDENLAALLQCNNSFILSLYANIDMGIHYDGWNLEETIKYLEDFGISDGEAAQDIYYNIIEEPANYLKYYIGYLEFLDLKQTAQEKEGDQFQLKEFHEKILSVGPSPFKILSEYIYK